MSTSSRRKDTSVTQQLIDAPYQFSFNQAVRLLERSANFVETNNTEATRANKSVARFYPPNQETVRFVSNQTLEFNNCEIAKIHQTKTPEHKAESQWQLLVNFLGLTGSQGVLPFHYSELILQRNKLKDPAIAAFLDLFNHRTISLFYQASTKYRLPVEYERKKLFSPGLSTRDTQTQALLSIIGLGTEHLTNRLYTRDESLLFYGGLFSQNVKNATSLENMLSSHFEIPVKVEQFVGQWQELIDDVRSRLPSKEYPEGQNNALGKSAMLGKKGWSAHSKVRIVLGPLNKDQAARFSPKTSALAAVNELVKLYLGMEYDYDFVLKIERSTKLDKAQLDPENPPMMGWNTWLLGSEEQNNEVEKETLNISVSANRFN
ncbi:type VI secretion system baseplate subunit TssG [Aliikangiella sp. G2MR2-5]|uniref:type VI secretion system baseplate subunit TssG n=1 Tax=Aliikangiella sp. G2MR2-5 TaxID=2788943 RepID=UPI0018AC59E9|nr:type VI secretion system baseplate subunit TssG [Aliikangiella sp. G2MR2-5]